MNAIYSAPHMNVEVFNANEYVAACLTKNHYIASCDVSGKIAVDSRPYNGKIDGTEGLFFNLKSSTACGDQVSMVKESFIYGEYNGQRIYCWKTPDNQWHASYSIAEDVEHNLS